MVSGPGRKRTERRVLRNTCTEVIDGRGCAPELTDREATRVGGGGADNIVHIRINIGICLQSRFHSSI